MSYAPGAPPEIWALAGIDDGAKLTLAWLWGKADHADQRDLRACTVKVAAFIDEHGKRHRPGRSLVLTLQQKVHPTKSERTIRGHLTRLREAGLADADGRHVDLTPPPLATACQVRPQLAGDSLPNSSVNSPQSGHSLPGCAVNSPPQLNPPIPPSPPNPGDDARTREVDTGFIAVDCEECAGKPAMHDCAKCGTDGAYLVRRDFTPDPEEHTPGQTPNPNQRQDQHDQDSRQHEHRRRQDQSQRHQSNGQRGRVATPRQGQQQEPRVDEVHEGHGDPRARLPGAGDDATGRAGGGGRGLGARGEDRAGREQRPQAGPRLTQEHTHGDTPRQTDETRGREQCVRRAFAEPARRGVATSRSAASDTGRIQAGDDRADLPAHVEASLARANGHDQRGAGRHRGGGDGAAVHARPDPHRRGAPGDARSPGSAVPGAGRGAGLDARNAAADLAERDRLARIAARRAQPADVAARAFEQAIAAVGASWSRRIQDKPSWRQAMHAAREAMRLTPEQGRLIAEAWEREAEGGLSPGQPDLDELWSGWSACRDWRKRAAGIGEAPKRGGMNMWAMDGGLAS